ncbi:MAG: transposase, partial [Actinobacteria bacterium]|nr:transposase [Actinomycetota bacterium]
MASLYKKTINGKPYYYLRQMARVDGRPQMVSERYLGSAEDIAAAMAGRDAASLPERTRHRGFGEVAAVWGMLDRWGVVGLVDEVAGARRSGAGASVGTYLALAALNRVVAPCSQRAFADWWTTTAADRFTKISAAVLDHRRFWDAMHAVTATELAEIEHRLALRMIDVFGLDISALALDMTNFATYLDTTNTQAPIAARGKAKQKRTDLRLVGLGLVLTRDGGVPLVSHAYPGNRPDVTQFATMIDHLCTRHAAIAADRGQGQGGSTEVTVVFDAGQNSVANFAHLAAAGLGYVGSVPPSDCPD